MLVSVVGKGNMAAPPTYDGTKVSAPFVNEFVSITHEEIFIKPDSNFNSAFFDIKYVIDADKDGNQVPMLFYAMGYSKEFKVFFDGKEVDCIPVNDTSVKGTKFEPFRKTINFTWSDGKERVNVDWYWNGRNYGASYLLNELLFFELNLTKGSHIVEVKYFGKAWLEMDEWVLFPTHKYSLSPAQYWKSFGVLDVYLDQSNGVFNLKTTLDDRYLLNDSTPTMKHWRFNKMPDDKVIEISSYPELDFFTQILIWITPHGLMYIIFFILAFFHIKTIIAFRKNNLTSRFSYISIIGSLLVPFLAMCSLQFFYPLIDDLIGENAADYHGYYFLIFVLYPIIMPVYWLLMTWLDLNRRAKYREAKKKEI